MTAFSRKLWVEGLQIPDTTIFYGQKFYKQRFLSSVTVNVFHQFSTEYSFDNNNILDFRKNL